MGVAVALLVGFAVSGCRTPEACPEIGWFNHVTVSLAGAVDDVASVDVCEDGVCTSSTVGPLDLKRGSADLRQTGPKGSAPQSSVFSVTREDETTWRVTYVLAAPDKITLRAVA
ncbi:hypothetical protein SAMN04489834_2804 [Microterricola viridarii]|uniref:Uncharacterized protein n=1 Tax=Microterricola viridarii TaxID=412690 RepID=A0A1H1XIT6_9MICO|nr:hypothetical protein SAMN04489834_2804 [Microterricola viridarii]